MVLKETYFVPELSKNCYITDYPVSSFKSVLSKSAFKKKIKKGLVFINDNKANSSNLLRGGETISIYEDDLVVNQRVPQVDIKVLFEDEHLAVIHKPSGVQVSGNVFKTVQRALPKHLKPSSQLDALAQAQPAHRLDFPTSGILIIGKTTSALSALNGMFEEKRIQKTYYALAGGEFEEVQGIIDVPIDDKKAQSQYEVVATTPSPKFGVLNLIQLNPITGRRHQLRKHLLQLGHPIVGDPDYGNIELNTISKGLFLHAYQIELEHPITEELLVVTSPLPKKFLRLFPEFKS